VMIRGRHGHTIESDPQELVRDAGNNTSNRFGGRGGASTLSHPEWSR
jgi:hypothetical protein